MNHCDFILSLFLHCRYGSYLELGVYDGVTLDKINSVCSNCVGVDMKDVRKNKQTKFFKMTTDEFFKINTNTFDVIFIDANHDIDFVRRDFDNSLKVLNKGGVILLHDTDPQEEYLKQGGYCSDAYKIREYLGLNFDHITLPMLECGITIVRNKGDYRS